MNVFVTQFFDPATRMTALMTAIVVIFSICLHEFCHAWCALLFGDSTAADHGHLTLNPLRQMGVTSLIMFLIIGVAWGAVPVDNAKLRERNRWAPTLTALAGPAANLVLALIGWIGFGSIAVSLPERPGPLAIYTLEMTFLLGLYNIVLLFFNLLPVPGLDGWNAIIFAFPRLLFKVSSEAVKGVMIFLFFAIFMMFGHIVKFAQWIMFFALALFSKFNVSFFAGRI